MVLMNSSAHDDEPDAERGEAKRRSGPVAAGIKERDECGQHAVAHAAQRQSHAVRRHAAQHMRRTAVLARLHRTGCLAPGHDKAHGADQDRQQADGARPHC